MDTVIVGFLVLAACLLLKVAIFLYHEYVSSLRRLPGPKSTSWMYGNSKDIWDNDTVVDEWVSAYGPTFKYRGFGGAARLFTIDTKAISHVVMKSKLYQRPESLRYNMRQMFGNGLLVATGDEHKLQRKIMGPAFGVAQMREITSIFFDKAAELRNIWVAEVMKQNGSSAYVDVLPWFNKATLDAIGLAGFNYQFNSLSRKGDGEANELHRAFATVFHLDAKMPTFPALRMLFPILRFLFLSTHRGKAIKRAKQTMSRIGHELVEDVRASAIPEKSSLPEKDSGKGRDLLSLLVRGNMASDLPDSQRMSDDNVLAQIPTFIVTGHESTGVATTWALFALAQHPDVQEKLRAELLGVSTDNPTMDELNALPYLDRVVRESLRIHPPISWVKRVVVRDDTIPLEKPVQDEEGNIHEYISVRQGQSIVISILALHSARDIWGEDAKEFRPERWESIPQAAHTIPGVWGNLLSFLGGSRGCIGYRFAIIEMKAFLFTLLRTFQIQLAVTAADVKGRSSFGRRPYLASDPSMKSQMPLLIKLHQDT